MYVHALIVLVGTRFLGNTVYVLMLLQDRYTSEMVLITYTVVS